MSWFSHSTARATAPQAVAKTSQIAEHHLCDKVIHNLCLDKLAQAGQSMDRNGLTKAGRALQKHGDRPFSAFPKAKGNCLQVNAQGQYHVEDILTHPKSMSSIDISNYKKGVKIYSPDGRGLYYRQDGQFRGFIERKYEMYIQEEKWFLIRN